MTNKNNKIGILTFFNSENYGAVLQGFALLKTIEALGGNAEIINYPVQYVKLSQKRKFIHGLWMLLRPLGGFSKKKKDIGLFIRDELGVKRDVINITNTKEICEYSKWVVGSDQVWNLDITKDPAFRLEFTLMGQKKYSYAASFGKDSLNTDEEIIFKQSLSDFNAISVREESGLAIVGKLGYSAKHVLDPTLLLTCEEWKHYLNLENTIHGKKKYVLCYLLMGNSLNEHIIREAHKYASANNWDIYVIGARDFYALQFWSDIVYINNAGPISFLSYLYNAQMVFTNSYHGTCFSLIFHKQFFTFIRGGFGRNHRITELLSKMKLSERIIDNIEQSAGIIRTNGQIDYDTVDSVLDNLRLKSKLFIKDLIEE